MEETKKDRVVIKGRDLEFTQSMKAFISNWIEKEAESGKATNSLYKDFFLKFTIPATQYAEYKKKITDFKYVHFSKHAAKRQAVKDEKKTKHELAKLLSGMKKSKELQEHITANNQSQLAMSLEHDIESLSIEENAQALKGPGPQPVTMSAFRVYHEKKGNAFDVMVDEYNKTEKDKKKIERGLKEEFYEFDPEQNMYQHQFTNKIIELTAIQDEIIANRKKGEQEQEVEEEKREEYVLKEGETRLDVLVLKHKKNGDKNGGDDDEDTDGEQMYSSRVKGVIEKKDALFNQLSIDLAFWKKLCQQKDLNIQTLQDFNANLMQQLTQKDELIKKLQANLKHAAVVNDTLSNYRGGSIQGSVYNANL